MSVYSNTLVRDVLERLGDPNNPATRLSRFNQKELIQAQFNDMKPLQWLMSQNNEETEAAIQSLLQRKQTATQATRLDLWNRPGGSVSTDLTLAGFQTGSTARQNIPLGTLISRKVTFDFSNLIRWDSELTTEQKVEAEFAYLMRDAYLKIMQQMNTQFLAFLDANTAAGGGLGNVYTVGANPNIKAIPSTEQNAFNGIWIDGVVSNRFISNSEMSQPAIIGSPMLWAEIKSYEQFAVQNARNAAMQLPLFEYVPSDSIAPIDPLVESWRAFLIDRQSLYGTTWVTPLDFSLPLGLGDFGNKSFSTFEMPANLRYGMPSVRLGLYVENNFADNYVAFGSTTEEDRLNRVTNMVVYTYPVFHQIYVGPGGGSNNIVSYEKLI